MKCCNVCVFSIIGLLFNISYIYADQPVELPQTHMQISVSDNRNLNAADFVAKKDLPETIQSVAGAMVKKEISEARFAEKIESLQQEIKAKDSTMQKLSSELDSRRNYTSDIDRIEAFYDRRFLTLLWTMGIIIAIFGISFPVIVACISNLSLQNDRRDIKKANEKVDQLFKQLEDFSQNVSYDIGVALSGLASAFSNAIEQNDQMKFNAFRTYNLAIDQFVKSSHASEICDIITHLYRCMNSLPPECYADFRIDVGKATPAQIKEVLGMSNAKVYQKYEELFKKIIPSQF